MAWHLGGPLGLSLVTGKRIIALRGFYQRSGAEFCSPFVDAAALYFDKIGGE